LAGLLIFPFWVWGVLKRALVRKEAGQGVIRDATMTVLRCVILLETQGFHRA
jgi:hypothetical protein